MASTRSDPGTSLSEDERNVMFQRQLDILDPALASRLHVVVIGAGAIGSSTVVDLAKIGLTNIMVFDDDSVETHNIPNQWFRLKDVGKKKVDALKEIVEEFTGVTITAKAERYTDQMLPFGSLVISGVDSMEARIGIWKELKGQAFHHYIDARMGAEVGIIRVVDPANFLGAESYEKLHLYPSSEASPGPCTARSTMYCASGLAAIIASKVAALINGRKIDDLVIDFRNMRLVQA